MDEKKNGEILTTVPDEELSKVNGGWIPTQGEWEEFVAAANSINGKKCKYCHRVFIKDDVFAVYQNIKMCNTFIAKGRILPCLGCNRSRSVDRDFE